MSASELLQWEIVFTRSIQKVFSASKSNRSNDREFSDPKNEVPSKIVSKNAKQVEIKKAIQLLDADLLDLWSNLQFGSSHWSDQPSSETDSKLIEIPDFFSPDQPVAKKNEKKNNCEQLTFFIDRKLDFRRIY